MLVRAIEEGEPLERIQELANEAVEKKSLNQRNNEGTSALEMAVNAYPGYVEEKIDILYMLLDHGADASSIDASIVAFLGDEKLFHLFIEHGMDVDSQDESYRRITPLMNAIMNYALNRDNPDEEEINAWAIRMILEENPEVRLQDTHGYTALHFLLDGPTTSFGMEILPSLALPDILSIQNNDGMTPLLMYAGRSEEEYGYDEVDPDTVVSFLLERGAHVLERDNQGRTARDLAIRQGNEELARILQQKERNAREAAQGALVQRGRQGHQQRVPPTIARRITDFLGGKRKGRNARTKKGRNARTKKGRKTRSRR